MLFPNDIQAAILFDRPAGALEEMVRTFVRVEEARTGARFNVPESKAGTFYRLFGGDEMMVTFEYVDRPPNLELFQKTLASAVTGIICPDIRQRLTTCRSHILVNVSHGVLGSSEQIDRMMEMIGRPKEGHSLAQLTRRLDVCALIGRIVCDHAPAQAVHWVQSNQLIPGESFEDMAKLGVPGPLHIHPYLFGQADGPDGKARVGIRSFGARHFIGRELLIEPSELPWAANYETMLAFLRVATIEKGYVIPDGDTFGPEDRSLSYRVVHRDAEPDDVPLFELQPLMYREFGFVSPDYVPRERVFDDRMPPADLMPPDQDAKMALANEWREKRALAEGIGARFEVRARHGEGGAPPPPVRPVPGFGNRPVFGRKKA